MKTGTISEEYNYHCREIVKQRDVLKDRVDFLEAQNSTLLREVERMHDALRLSAEQSRCWMEDYATLRRCVDAHLTSTMLADKTPQYEYGHGAKSANRDGVYPPTGQRWLTPHELARSLAISIARLPKC